MARKCGNCIYFVKKGLFSSYCDYRRRYGSYYGTDLVSENETACSEYSETCEADSNLSNNGTTSDCFLTSACVDFLGKPDDCEELTELRRYRDVYLANSEGGAEVIKEYYKIAPQIVNSINSSDRKESHYEYIYGEIKKCLNCIAQNKNEETLEIYKGMVETLRKEFFK